MNKKTYEALKRVIEQAEKVNIPTFSPASGVILSWRYFDNKDIQEIKDWIDEVAKEYED
jgi:hypothetical protein